MTSSERIAYPINHHQGCEGAGYQACATADRPMAAFISAYAAWLHDKTSLKGTLNGADQDTIRTWVKDMCAEYQLPLGRAATFARSVNGQRLPAPTPEQRAASIGGLLPDDYQILAISSALVAGAGLAMGVGLGKTLTASWLARHALHCKVTSNSRLWIICPLNAFGAWNRFLPDLKVLFKDVRVLSIDSTHKYVGCDNSGGVLICDEVHMAGDKNSRRTKATHDIRLKFDFCIGLTGTLTHAGVEKCLSVMDLIVPGLSLFASRWKAGEYFRCLVRKTLGTRVVTSLEKPSGECRSNFLGWLSRGVISLTKNSPEVRASVTIPEQKVYEVRVEEPWEDLDAEVARIAEEIFKAEGELPHIQRVVHRLCRSGIEAKVDWLLENITDADTGIVVFAHYRESLDFVADRLTDCGISFVRVDGETPQAERPALQERFQTGGVQVFLGQTTAAGIAIDLFRAQVSVTVDHSWKAIDYAQSLGRTCRRGQDYLCHHFNLVANSLQQRIVERINDAQDFDASVAEYQTLRRAFNTSMSLHKGSHGLANSVLEDGHPATDAGTSRAAGSSFAIRQDDAG